MDSLAFNFTGVHTEHPHNWHRNLPRQGTHAVRRAKLTYAALIQGTQLVGYFILFLFSQLNGKCNDIGFKLEGKRKATIWVLAELTQNWSFQTDVTSAVTATSPPLTLPLIKAHRLTQIIKKCHERAWLWGEGSGKASFSSAFPATLFSYHKIYMWWIFQIKTNVSCLSQVKSLWNTDIMK